MTSDITIGSPPGGRFEFMNRVLPVRQDPSDLGRLTRYIHGSNWLNLSQSLVGVLPQEGPSSTKHRDGCRLCELKHTFGYDTTKFNQSTWPPLFSPNVCFLIYAQAFSQLSYNPEERFELPEICGRGRIPPDIISY